MRWLTRPPSFVQFNMKNFGRKPVDDGHYLVVIFDQKCNVEDAHLDAKPNVQPTNTQHANN